MLTVKDLVEDHISRFDGDLFREIKGLIPMYSTVYMIADIIIKGGSIQLNDYRRYVFRNSEGKEELILPWEIKNYLEEVEEKFQIKIGVQVEHRVPDEDIPLFGDIVNVRLLIGV